MEQYEALRIRVTCMDRFQHSHPGGHRSAIRISRIVSETLRLLRSTTDEEEEEDVSVRWFVMGHDDTFFFVPDNLARVLPKYDHSQMHYYIGSWSESHLHPEHLFLGPRGRQLRHQHPTAGGPREDAGSIGASECAQGFMVRMIVPVEELGVPLTREQGFHQVNQSVLPVFFFSFFLLFFFF